MAQSYAPLMERLSDFKCGDYTGNAIESTTTDNGINVRANQECGKLWDAS